MLNVVAPLPAKFLRTSPSFPRPSGHWTASWEILRGSAAIQHGSNCVKLVKLWLNHRLELYGSLELNLSAFVLKQSASVSSVEIERVPCGFTIEMLQKSKQKNQQRGPPRYWRISHRYNIYYSLVGSISEFCGNLHHSKGPVCGLMALTSFSPNSCQGYQLNHAGQGHLGLEITV